MLHTYGVEAARTSIAKEINAVFNVYGISVDYRHLSLISDYMTNLGDFRAMNRMGIANNDSVFQKASFETSMNFILNACINGDVDQLQSPSAKIVLGQPPKVGTGLFTLQQPIMLN